MNEKIERAAISAVEEFRYLKLTPSECISTCGLMLIASMQSLGFNVTQEDVEKFLDEVKK